MRRLFSAGDHINNTEVIIVQTFLVGRTFVFVEGVEESAEEDPEDDQETGLRNFGGDDVCPVESQLGQTGEKDETHDSKIVLHLLPPPANQAEILSYHGSQVSSRLTGFVSDAMIPHGRSPSIFHQCGRFVLYSS